MKNIFTIVGVISLILLASCTKQEENDVVSVLTDDTQNTQEVAQEGQMEESQELAANYREYSSEYIGVTDNTVIFFHAAWCPSCRTADESISASGIPDGTLVLKADYDSQTELKKKYGITSQHTFVQVDADGNMIKKWSSANSADDIVAQLEITAMQEDAMMEEENITEDSIMQEDEEVMMDNPENTMMDKEDTGISEEEYLAMGTTIEQETTLEDSQGLYMDYSVSGLSETENTVIFFHANWCPSCRAADKGILEGKIPEDLTILKADFDTQTELRKKYSVVSQHTFVQVDADGNEIKKWVGGTGVDDILGRLQ